MQDFINNDNSYAIYKKNRVNIFMAFFILRYITFKNREDRFKYINIAVCLFFISILIDQVYHWFDFSFFDIFFKNLLIGSSTMVCVYIISLMVDIIHNWMDGYNGIDGTPVKKNDLFIFFKILRLTSAQLIKRSINTEKYCGGFYYEDFRLKFKNYINEIKPKKPNKEELLINATNVVNEIEKLYSLKEVNSLKKGKTLKVNESKIL